MRMASAQKRASKANASALAAEKERDAAELVNCAGRLGGGDELDGRDIAALRMLPAHQRFEVGQASGLGLDDGLVGEAQRAVTAQRVGELALLAMAPACGPSPLPSRA